LKYLEISFTSLEDLARIGEGNLLILASLSALFSSFFPVLMGLFLGVNLDVIFCLKKLLFSSVRSESHPEL